MEQTFTLASPVSLGDVQYTEITLRAPTVGELKKARAVDPAAQEGYIASLISQIGKVPMGAVDKITAGDFGVLSGFLSASMSPTSASSKNELPS